MLQISSAVKHTIQTYKKWKQKSFQSMQKMLGHNLYKTELEE